MAAPPQGSIWFPPTPFDFAPAGPYLTTTLGREPRALPPVSGSPSPSSPGGLVFVPFMVGPISTAAEMHSAPGFMHSALKELQSLEVELGDPDDEFDDELCVDELRVLSQEELVECALQEAVEPEEPP
ncbi:unnamed protein product [Urochloa humidicola]